MHTCYSGSFYKRTALTELMEVFWTTCLIQPASAPVAKDDDFMQMFSGGSVLPFNCKRWKIMEMLLDKWMESETVYDAVKHVCYVAGNRRKS